MVSSNEPSDGAWSAAQHLDELIGLRTAGLTDDAVALAESIWDVALRTKEGNQVGAGAAYQIAFIALMDAGRAAEAQVWRARAMTVASQTGELNTIAMLVVPIAFMANDIPDIDGNPSTDVAVEIMSEVARAGRALENAGWSGPGVSVQVLWRVYYEKTGFLNWRGRRYDVAVSHYKQARDHAPEGTRDRVRIEAGLLLAVLGQEESTVGAFDRVAASRDFGKHLSAALDGGWNDVAAVFKENLKRLSDGVASVQDLRPVEVERRS